MVQVERLVCRYLVSKEVYGPRIPLNVREKTMKYRVKANSSGIMVVIYDGVTRMGGVLAHPTGNILRIECSKDAIALLDRYPELEDVSIPRREVWGEFIPNVKMLVVSNANLVDGVPQGQGIGRAMYQALMAEWFDRVGPFLFMPHACGTVGSTSASARLVWRSLAQRFPSSGLVLAVLKRPTM